MTSRQAPDATVPASSWSRKILAVVRLLQLRFVPVPIQGSDQDVQIADGHRGLNLYEKVISLRSDNARKRRSPRRGKQ